MYDARVIALLHRNLPLAQRLEAAEVELTDSWIRAAALDPGSKAGSIPIGSGRAMIAGPASPFNSVKGLALAGPVTAADFDTIESFFRSRGGGPIVVDVCPLADPSLWAILAERGYTLAEFEHVLARPTQPGDADIADDPSIAIEIAMPADALTYSMTLATGFTGQAEPPQWMIDLGLHAFRIPEGTRLLAKIDGRVVGASGIRVIDKLACFLGMATLPDARGKGVQTAIIRHRIRAAARAGCDVMKADVKPGSQSHRNFERQGFTIAYTRAQCVKTL